MLQEAAKAEASAAACTRRANSVLDMCASTPGRHQDVASVAGRGPLHPSPSLQQRFCELER
jgi:hypothetical protein